MASRLFHTIVGVGISLSAAACSSAPAQQEPAANDDSAYLTGSSGSGSTTTTPTPPPPPCHDAGPTGPDWNAFCDATWPTTKGGVLPLAECIDPKHECKDKGEPFDCAKPGKAPGACQSWDSTVSVCAEQTWQCKPGRINAGDCKCWEWDGGTTCPASGGDASASSSK